MNQTPDIINKIKQIQKEKQENGEREWGDSLLDEMV